MADKNSVIFYQQQISICKNHLNMEQFGRLMSALFSLEAGEEIDVSDDELVSICYDFMSLQSRINKEKYDETRARRAEAGRKGGQKSAEVRQANQANASFAQANPSKSKQEQANQANPSLKIREDKISKDKLSEDKTTTSVVGGGHYKVDDEFNLWKKLTPEDIDVLYEKFPNSGGLLIDEVFAEVKNKKVKVKSGLNYILGYAKNVGWDDNAEHFTAPWEAM